MQQQVASAGWQAGRDGSLYLNRCARISGKAFELILVSNFTCLAAAQLLSANIPWPLCMGWAQLFSPTVGTLSPAATVPVSFMGTNEQKKTHISK